MTTEISPVRPRDAAHHRLRELQNDIMDLILRRDLEVGDLMPTESELCEELGVGRNSLRESLKVLQAIGVVEIRHGYGTFVAETSFRSLAASLAFRGRLSLRHGGEEARELVDVRQALESGLIGSAIDATDDDDLRELDHLVTVMEEKARHGDAFITEDREFHRRLYLPLRNELLSNLLDVFWTVYRNIHEDAGIPPEGLIEGAAQHREILDAISARDHFLAADRLNRHFDGIRRHLARVESEGGYRVLHE